MSDDFVFKIEKGVLRPPKYKYRFREMEIDDSVLIPGDLADSARMIAQRIPGMKFESHREGDNLRIWRVK